MRTKRRTQAERIAALERTVVRSFTALEKMHERLTLLEKVNAAVNEQSEQDVANIEVTDAQVVTGDENNN